MNSTEKFKSFPTWINQPSTLQPLHMMHGVRGSAWDDENTITTKDINFCVDGFDESYLVPRLSIQDGNRENYVKRIFLCS